MSIVPLLCDDKADIRAVLCCVSTQLRRVYRLSCAPTRRSFVSVAWLGGRVLAIPASLQASLMARLDRLGPAKEVAQIGVGLGASSRMRSWAQYLVSRKPSSHRRSAEIAKLKQTRHQFGLALRDGSEAVGLWGKAGQRSLERSALVEAMQQFTRALDQIGTLPSTPELRRQEINFQVATITPLLNIKRFAAPETKAATDGARLLIEKAEALGEPPDDPLLLFTVLFSFWVANFVAFNGDLALELAAQFLAHAEKQSATFPQAQGQVTLGLSSTCTGRLTEGRARLDRAVALYDPDAHRPLATRLSGSDLRVASLSFRSLTVWMLGHPEAALADVDQALKGARVAREPEAATPISVLQCSAAVHLPG
jgi:hypothetical protein